MSRSKEMGMTLLAVALSGLIWVGYPSLVVAGSFEGVVVMKRFSDVEVSTHKTYFKGEKMRADGERDGDYMVWDSTTHEGFVVESQERSMMILPQNHLKSEDVMKMFEGTTVTKTGKRRKVAGYPCEIYVGKDDDGTSEVCIAKGISNAAFYGLLSSDPAGGGGYPFWIRDIIKDGGFPLREIERDESRNEVSREEAIHIKTQRLDDSLFAPPAGYRTREYAPIMK
jgi:hypothetical protein